MEIATDQDAAASRLAAGIDLRVAEQADALTQHLHLAALARAGRRRHAACIQHSVPARLEHDLAVLSHHGAVGVDHALLADQGAIDACLAALCDHLSEVQRAVLRRAHDNMQVRISGIHQLHAASCRQ